MNVWNGSRMVVVLVAISLFMAGATAGSQEKAEEEDSTASAVQDSQDSDEENPAGDPAKGKELFEANCVLCHDAESTEERVGPGLKGVSERKTEEAMRAQIQNGSEMMTPFGDVLSEEEINDVIAYLQTL